MSIQIANIQLGATVKVQLRLHGPTDTEEGRDAAGKLNAAIAYLNTVLMRTPTDDASDIALCAETGEVQP